MRVDDTSEKQPLDYLSRKFHRRDLLKLSGSIGVSVALTGLLAACGGDDDDDDDEDVGADEEPTTDDEETSPDDETESEDEESEDDVEPTTESQAGGRVVYGIWQNPDTLDPGASGLIATSKIAVNVFDPLIFAAQDTEEDLYPGLATAWDVNDDATEFSFTLREGVTFHDGTPFNAEAVQRTWDHIVDPETQSLGAAGLLNPADSYEGTEVVNDFEVTVRFSAPNGGFLNNVATIGLAPMSPAALDEYGADIGQNPVGTGPFMFEEWEAQDHVTIVKNPEYDWAPDPFGRNGEAHLDEITFRIIPEASTRAVTIESGEVDMVEELTPDDFNRLDDSDDFRGLTIPTTGMPYDVMVNVTKAPTDELAVRQALQFAIDRDAIVETLYEGLYEPAYAPVDPTTLGFDPSLEEIYQYDPDRAQELLDEAGWVAGDDGMRSKDGTSLDILFINLAGFGFDGIAQFMQGQLGEIGINMEITEQSFPAVQEELQGGEHNLAPFFYYAVDPSFVNSIYACEAVSTFNWMHYCDEEAEDLIAEGQEYIDADERAEVYVELNRKLMDDAVMIPIYYKAVVLTVKEGIDGFQYTVNGFPYFYNVTTQ